MPKAGQVAVIVGASSGLGLAVARSFLQVGYDVCAVGRQQSKLDEAKAFLVAELPAIDVQQRFVTFTCDAANKESVHQLFDQVQTTFGRLDALINCVGQSDRGNTISLTREKLIELFDANVTTALHCSQAAFPLLKQSQGVVVNVGSLASKVGAKHLGGYPAVKHALAGLTQQMRLEWKDSGVHVALVSPGPIRRSDEGTRYQSHKTAEGLPPSAMLPGGGTSIRGVKPEKVAELVLRCVRYRTPDIVIPGHLRVLFALGHLFPRLGDWLLNRSTKKS
jgi:NAD(P)-dependent dehydrogenase (short-subunit alcohol dehydrogenase family)